MLHGHGSKGGVHARLARVGRRDRVALNTPHGGVLNYKPDTIEGGVFRRIERMIGLITDAYIFESEYAERRFHELIGKPPCAEAVIHNGIAPAELEPLTPDLDARDFVFVGEFRGAKGIGYLVDALAAAKAPDGRPATLAMAGSGPELESTRARIAELGLSGRIELLGVKPVREALRRGRCLVVASLAESLPYVILEGASAGVPVLSTNVGGISEIFGPTSASLFPPADAGAIRAANGAVPGRSGRCPRRSCGAPGLYPAALFDRPHGGSDRGSLRPGRAGPARRARVTERSQGACGFSLRLHRFVPRFQPARDHPPQSAPNVPTRSPAGRPRPRRPQGHAR